MAALAAFALALAAAPASAAFKYGSPVPFNVGLAPGPNPISAAVDNSTNPSDPSAGDIYVASGTAINRYTPAQAAAASSTPAAQLSGFSYAWGVAVDPADGNVYATDYEVPSTVRKFDPEGNPLPFNAPALAGDLSNPALSNPAGIAVNPNDRSRRLRRASRYRTAPRWAFPRSSPSSSKAAPTAATTRHSPRP